jgi:hypothetical protein
MLSQRILETESEPGLAIVLASHTGTRYVAVLGNLPDSRQSFTSPEPNYPFTYDLRPVTSVRRASRGGPEAPIDGAAFIGYSVTGGNVVILNAELQWLQFSSTILDSFIDR